MRAACHGATWQQSEEGVVLQHGVSNYTAEQSVRCSQLPAIWPGQVLVSTASSTKLLGQQVDTVNVCNEGCMPGQPPDNGLKKTQCSWECNQ